MIMENVGKCVFIMRHEVSVFSYASVSILSYTGAADDKMPIALKQEEMSAFHKPR